MEAKAYLEELGVDTNQVFDDKPLLSIIEGYYQHKLSEIREKLPPNNEDFEMINVKMILKYLGISRGSLHNYERQGILKAYYLGSKKYYKRQEVLGAFEEKELLK